MSNETKLTAVEWLVQELTKNKFIAKNGDFTNPLIEQAKEMENREIRFDIEEKWKQFRSITNNEDAWLFKEWLIEQTYGGDK